MDMDNCEHPDSTSTAFSNSLGSLGTVEFVVANTIGVTSNLDRDVKTHHRVEFDQWSRQLNKDDPNQTKLVDFVARKIQSSPCLMQSYPGNHERLHELQNENATTQDLIIDVGFALSLVERPGFLRFMDKTDSKLSMISRRTLSRTTIPALYNKMNESLKQFCSSSEYISLTLDIWASKRMRPFLSITVTDNSSNNIKTFGDRIILGFEQYFSMNGDDTTDGSRNER
ncbi:unnamed protein product [Adineta ricciae]|uniref:Uncharacterized protein n=1 Tax=Adineta ricciae TaxID=249248 RepID=A0A815WU40_ADIRI|nr:unnamed protein product [Adineta ricciae]CAF1626372.1 unnamed protein product [Adineta ricciae]